MRGNQCAINSPRFTATSSRGLFEASHGIVFLLGCPCTTASSPAPIPPRLAKGYSLLAENYFNLLSRVSPLLFSPFSLSFEPFSSSSSSFPSSSSSSSSSSRTRRKERDLWRRVYYHGSTRYVQWPMLYRSWSISRLQRVCLVNEIVSRIDMERWVNLLDSFIFERAKGKSD